MNILGPRGRCCRCKGSCGSAGSVLPAPSVCCSKAGGRESRAGEPKKGSPKSCLIHPQACPCCGSCCRRHSVFSTWLCGNSLSFSCVWAELDVCDGGSICLAVHLPVQSAVMSPGLILAPRWASQSRNWAPLRVIALSFVVLGHPCPGQRWAPISTGDQPCSQPAAELPCAWAADWHSHSLNRCPLLPLTTGQIWLQRSAFPPAAKASSEPGQGWERGRSTEHPPEAPGGYRAQT